MSDKNIFGGQSTRALFAHYIYKELLKREFVTLVDVLCLYYQREEFGKTLKTMREKAPKAVEHLLRTIKRQVFDSL